MPCGVNQADSNRMSVVASVTPLWRPPITPARASAAPDSSEMRRSSGGEGVLGFVEGEEGFAVVGVADDDAAGEFGGIEGMQRLAEFVEHEVGDIDDVVDRAQADGFEALFEPGRAIP